MRIKTLQNVIYHFQPLRMGLTTKAEDKVGGLKIFTADLGKGGWAISLTMIFKTRNISTLTLIHALIQ